MKLSLVSAYYKNELMTQDFLNNLKGKLPKDTEVILVNAGSKPIENPIVTERIDLPENQSFSNSFNAGIQVATGDYICVINNDAFPDSENWLQKLVEIAELSGAWVTAPVNDKTDLNNYTTVLEEEKYREVKFFPAVCWLMTRQCIEKVGLFDEQFIGGSYEDNDYCERLSQVGEKIIVTEKVKIKHLESQTMKLLDDKNVTFDNYEKFRNKYK